MESSTTSDALTRLVEIVDRLLGPNGCPWDREQTHESLKKHLLEEVYEVFDAIDCGDAEALKEELGDLLLQPIMHAQMEARDGSYSIVDVAATISDKLVRRHPHVFGGIDVADADEVLRNWDSIKKGEKPADRASSILGGVPRSAPSLLRAHETSKRAARIGFEWESLDDVFAKLDEEVAELKRAIASGESDHVEAEVGDVLFTVVNLARWSKVEPEDALRKMLDRFCDRFASMEANARRPLNELSLSEWDALWRIAKSRENR